MDWRLLLSFQLIGIKDNLASKSFEYFLHVSLCTNLCQRAFFKLPFVRYFKLTTGPEVITNL